MRDDLIKRLLNLDDIDAWQAASCIKELKESNKELTLQLLATSGQAADTQTKLAKAVEALREMHKKAMWLRGEKSYREFSRYVEKITRTTLAELEGQHIHPHTPRIHLEERD